MKYTCGCCGRNKECVKRSMPGSVGAKIFWKQLCLYMFYKDEVYYPNETFCEQCRADVRSFAKSVMKSGDLLFHPNHLQSVEASVTASRKRPHTGDKNMPSHGKMSVSMCASEQEISSANIVELVLQESSPLDQDEPSPMPSPPEVNRAEVDSFSCNLDIIDGGRHVSSNSQQDAESMVADTPSICTSRDSQSVGKSSQATSSCSRNYKKPAKVTLPSMKSVLLNENVCVVCGMKERHRVSWEAAVDTWISRSVYLPRGTRICEDHLEEGLLTQESKSLIVQKNKICLSISPEELRNWLTELTLAAETLRRRQLINFDEDSRLTNQDYKLLTGLSRDDFDTVFGYIRPYLRKSCNRTPRNALAILLCMLRMDLTQNQLAFLFGIENQQRISDIISDVSSLLVKHFVPLHLGFRHKTRENFIQDHMPSFCSKVLDAKEENIVTVLDGTYIYTQKPSNHELQKLLYSLHKHRHLVKFMFTVAPDGYIIGCNGPFFADSKNNDAAILSEMVNMEDGIMSLLQKDDHAVLDRGFLDVKGELLEKGLVVHMPEFIKKGQKQFTTSEANQTRHVTMIRWVVEAVNGRLKKKFKFFNSVMELSYLPKVGAFMEICLSLLNAFSPPLFTESDKHQQILRSLSTPTERNLMQERVENGGWTKRRSNVSRQAWRVATQEDVTAFPALSRDELFKITLGSFQIENAALYVEDVLRENSALDFEVLNEDNGVLLTSIRSKMTGGVSHSVWVNFDREKYGADAIVSYYCLCKNGARTCGCCGHVACVLWYLGVLRAKPTATGRKRFSLLIEDAGWRRKVGLEDSDDEHGWSAI